MYSVRLNYFTWAQRSKLSREPYELLFNFTVDELKPCGITLSVFKDKVLFSCPNRQKFVVYSLDGRFKSSIAVKDFFHSVMWTPQGNIIYTTSNQKVVIMSAETKETLTSIEGFYFSVSYDSIIYLNNEGCLYQSADEGVSWTFVLKPSLGLDCVYDMVKVTSPKNDDFWFRECNYTHCFLRVYSVDKRISSRLLVTWRDISQFCNSIDYENLKFARLLYDGTANIYLRLGNGSIYVHSVNGQYQGLLQSSYRIINMMWSMSTDQQRQLLYVGQSDGESLVGVFKFK